MLTDAIASTNVSRDCRTPFASSIATITHDQTRAAPTASMASVKATVTRQPNFRSQDVRQPTPIPRTAAAMTAGNITSGVSGTIGSLV